MFIIPNFSTTFVNRVEATKIWYFTHSVTTVAVPPELVIDACAKVIPEVLAYQQYNPDLDISEVSEEVRYDIQSRFPNVFLSYFLHANCCMYDKMGF